MAQHAARMPGVDSGHTGGNGIPLLSIMVGSLVLRSDCSIPDLLLGVPLSHPCPPAPLDGVTFTPSHPFLHPQEEFRKLTKFLFHPSIHLFNKYLSNGFYAPTGPSQEAFTCLVAPTALLCCLCLCRNLLSGKRLINPLTLIAANVFSLPGILTI